jgi:hypothetical protein
MFLNTFTLVIGKPSNFGAHELQGFSGGVIHRGYILHVVLKIRIMSILRIATNLCLCSLRHSDRVLEEVARVELDRDI